MLATFVLDIDKTFFTIPIWNHPITWYGTLFATGFFVSYLLVRHLFFCQARGCGQEVAVAKEQAHKLADRLSTFIVIGTLIGARLGHVFFYEAPIFLNDPSMIFKVWQGGLASHGAVVGITIALLLFYQSSKKQYSWLTFLTLLDAIALVAAYPGALIRIGNFINQEILGTPTTVPWAVVFPHPVQRAPDVALHPVQLYEALFYLAFGLVLYRIWYARKKVGEGRIAALFFLAIFSFRFFIEKFKLPQSDLINEQIITMGQILSLPCILFGLCLLVYSRYGRPNTEPGK